MKKFVILCLALFMSVVAFAQQSDASTIQVSGTAERYCAPDKFTIRITLNSVDFKNDKTTLAEKQRKLTSALKAEGLDLKNLTVGSMSQGVKTYSVRRADAAQTVVYTLELTDFGQVQRAFDAFDKAEIKDARLVSATLDNKTRIKNELLAEAVKNAYSQASILAEAAGVRIVGVRQISLTPYAFNTGGSTIVAFGMRKATNDAAEGVGESQVDEFSATDIRCSLSVSVTYIIADLQVSK